MNKEYKDMNTWDKIILEHQFALNNEHSRKVAENDANNKFWYTDKGKEIPEYMLSENHIKCSTLRYIAFEDTANKVWTFYDSETSQYLTIPFGQIAIDILNTFKIYNPSNPQYEKYVSKNLQQGLDKSIIDNLQDTSETCKDKLDYLFLFLSQFEDLKKKYSKSQFHTYIMTLWKQYRHCYFSAVWKEYVQHENTQEFFDICEKHGRKLTKKEKQEYIEGSKEEAEHTLYMLNDIVSKNFCIYHDIMTWNNDNEVVSGRVFVLEEGNYIFSVFAWDLYYILTEAVPMPHICKRCGQLYLSNNNKAKYCTDCKADSNKIRNENRRSNSCRYLHKQILDKLTYHYNNYQKDKEVFRIESNYYWDIVRGKTPKQIPDNYDSKIKTEKQYMKWLENYLK